MVADARIEAFHATRKLEGMAAAGKIAASVAHEINNPLEAVTNLLYLLQIGQIGEAERGYLEMAQRELRRIAEITTHTLKFYRQPSGPTPTSVPDLLDSALALFHKPLHGMPLVRSRLSMLTRRPEKRNNHEYRQIGDQGIIRARFNYRSNVRWDLLRIEMETLLSLANYRP